MKSKKVVLGIVMGCLCCVGVCSVLIFKNMDSAKAGSPATTVVSEVEGELFPKKELPPEYEKDNLFVQVNNKLVKAINDYTNGAISEEEYKAICAELSKIVQDEDNFKRMKEEEKELSKKVGKE